MKFARVALAATVAALVTATPAAAATKTYGGTAAIGGQVAIDVKLSKKGTPKRVTALRAVDLPATCEISGPNIPVNAELPVSLKVSKDGAFEFEYTDGYGNTSTLDGQFNGSGKKVTGKFVYASHFPAEAGYPEENCATGPTGYKIKKGGPDAVPGS